MKLYELVDKLQKLMDKGYSLADVSFTLQQGYCKASCMNVKTSTDKKQINIDFFLVEENEKRQ